MVSTSCPYCGNYNKNNFTFKVSFNNRDICCKKCGLKYNVNFYVQDRIHTYDEELKKVLPQDKIDTIKKVMTKYLGYQSKGGYANSRHIIIDDNFKERFSSGDNALVLSLKGKARYYGSEYRTVRFYVTHDAVRPEVTSEYTWVQRYWFKGETLDVCVDNYIQNALIKWCNI